ncbi:MAG: MBL fold metallo-hydrolase [Gammaproteobacteria bacterium]|jgi:glyoxylase-like metal-dependent hydrolase (beta-lactamase superfamily II)|nr:MBL fold metallo-hydrolase [Gammaproteobacteria bacterium]MBT5603297.1 MBL fold metallo-hydrolase [Gammaproteobacteria bacterium]MBT6244609.1 MBL fold metallo-hydrolase [Gammaproteobacteria bacterium]
MPISIPYVYKYSFEYAAIETISPLLRRVTARNPSGFTFNGTGTYIVGHGKVAVVDPGPLIPEHIEALQAALEGETVTHILITHTHADHSPAAAPLKQAWACPTYGYGPHGAGKIADGIPIEEGGDMDFTPDHELRDGDVINGDGWTIESVYTPGHTSNHLCFALREEKALLTGDHVMGWSTSVIGPPDGDMTAYMESLEKLLSRNDEVYWPTHGTCITDVKPFVRAFIDHRLDRERQIMACLTNGYQNISEMVPIMYKATQPALHPAAARSVLSATIRLVDLGKIYTDGPVALESKFHLSESAES